MGTVLYFNYGTIVIDSVEPLSLDSNLLIYDHRIKKYRTKACFYNIIKRYLVQDRVFHIDKAKEYKQLNLRLKSKLNSRYYQKEGLDIWLKKSGRGIISLPTGAGKTYLAMMAMEKINRSTLIIVPTIDLMIQWKDKIAKYFGLSPTLLGGGSKEISEITIATYNSASKMMEFIGNKFGLIIFDECHHAYSPIKYYLPSIQLPRIDWDCQQRLTFQII